MFETSFLNHFVELKKRILLMSVGWFFFTVLSFLFYNLLIRFFVDPFLIIEGVTSDALYVTSIFEGFMTKFKSCLFFGFVFSFPFTVFHVFRFIIPGLKRRERLFLLCLLVPSFCLTLFAVYMMYYTVLPYSIPFLTSVFFIPENTGILLHFHDSVFYIIQFLFVSVLLFQFPLLVLIVLYFKLFSIRDMLRFSRYIVIVLFLVSALLTPPDIISQLSLAIPLICMYFIAIFLAKCLGFGKTYA